MLSSEKPLQEHQDAGRWVVRFSGKEFKINTNDREIKLPYFRTQSNLRDNLKQLVDWTNTEPKRHGKFYVEGIMFNKMAPIYIELDDRFVVCVLG